jgi:hypothetical protein
MMPIKMILCAFGALGVLVQRPAESSVAGAGPGTEPERGILIRIDTLRIDSASSSENVPVVGGSASVLLAKDLTFVDPSDRARFVVEPVPGSKPRQYRIVVSTPGKSLEVGPVIIQSDSSLGLGFAGKPDLIPSYVISSSCWSANGRWLALSWLAYSGVDISLESLYLFNLDDAKLQDTAGPVGLGVLDFSPDSKFLVYSDFADLWVIDLARSVQIPAVTGGGYRDTGGENYEDWYSDVWWSQANDFFDIRFHSKGMNTYYLRVFVARK